MNDPITVGNVLYFILGIIILVPTIWYGTKWYYKRKKRKEYERRTAGCKCDLPDFARENGTGRSVCMKCGCYI